MAKPSSICEAMRPRLIAHMLAVNESLSFSRPWTSFFTRSRTGFCIFSVSAGSALLSSAIFAVTSAGSDWPVERSNGARSSSICRCEGVR